MIVTRPSPANSTPQNQPKGLTWQKVAKYSFGTGAFFLVPGLASYYLGQVRARNKHVATKYRQFNDAERHDKGIDLSQSFEKEAKWFKSPQSHELNETSYPLYFHTTRAFSALAGIFIATGIFTLLYAGGKKLLSLYKKPKVVTP